MEKRRIVFEFEDCKEGIKCTANGSAFRFEDLCAINEFALDMMHSFVELHMACYEQMFGKGEN